ncbi:Dolichol-phosphate mannosyltransferase subunit 3 [Carpediemonas membranifera]|uniref:Dolichol-phosphate mannosyltransferase subunit 3 n=1 Tax=Carpediemonas membranifera TaxID=201153 RepID=A0A8J6BCC3_9EUKA|nr:Dolichol-phosphate mannosyltransferase subunit 3 [Carpediemonas membranifera]|eukprot:KAG9394452.1 Dolichol-phosphate mannosyltransferase subunit 3 [Carpediemonas membranifera]
MRLSLKLKLLILTNCASTLLILDLLSMTLFFNPELPFMRSIWGPPSSSVLAFIRHVLCNYTSICCVGMGAYASVSVGWKLFTFVDTPTAAKELSEEIKEAKAYLADHGFKK